MNRKFELKCKFLITNQKIYLMLENNINYFLWLIIKKHAIDIVEHFKSTNSGISHKQTFFIYNQPILLCRRLLSLKWSHKNWSIEEIWSSFNTTIFFVPYIWSTIPGYHDGSQQSSILTTPLNNPSTGERTDSLRILSLRDSALIKPYSPISRVYWTAPCMWYYNYRGNLLLYFLLITRPPSRRYFC